jgi:hypothetical protein
MKSKTPTGHSDSFSDQLLFCDLSQNGRCLCLRYLSHIVILRLRVAILRFQTDTGESFQSGAPPSECFYGAEVVGVEYDDDEVVQEGMSEEAAVEA